MYITNLEFMTTVVISVFIGIGTATLILLWKRYNDGKHTY